jgi:hypothetical protein
MTKPFIFHYLELAEYHIFGTKAFRLNKLSNSFIYLG